jgi:hypothetical protein
MVFKNWFLKKLVMGVWRQILKVENQFLQTRMTRLPLI